MSNTKKYNEIIVKNNSAFLKQKEKLREFSNRVPSGGSLTTVPTSGGLFGIFDYKVTGDDLNRLTREVQDKVISQNKNIIEIIKEFNTIYDTFSALDKEYLQGIIVSVKASEVANDKARESIRKVELTQHELQQVIAKDKKVVEQLGELRKQDKQMIEVLKSFKMKIDKLNHLNDIDKIYEKIIDTEKRIKGNEKSLGIQNKTLEQLNSTILSQRNFIDAISKNSRLLEAKIVELKESNDISLEKMDANVLKQGDLIENVSKETIVLDKKIGDLRDSQENALKQRENDIAKQNNIIDKIEKSINANKESNDNSLEAINSNILEQGNFIESVSKETVVLDKKIGDLRDSQENVLKQRENDIAKQNNVIDKIEKSISDNKVSTDSLKAEIDSWKELNKKGLEELTKKLMYTQYALGGSVIAIVALVIILMKGVL